MSPTLSVIIIVIISKVIKSSHFNYFHSVMGLHCKSRLLALHINIRLISKQLTMTNTLAYYHTELIIDVQNYWTSPWLLHRHLIGIYHTVLDFF
jgi:hypothetical protein